MSLPPPKPVAAKLPATFALLRGLGDQKPRLDFGFPPREAPGTLRLVLPFRRNWLLIAIVGVVLAIFAMPLFGLFGNIGPPEGDLFALVFSLFQLFWGLGWSVGVGVIGLIFLGLLLGREVVMVRPDSLLVRLEVLGLGVGGAYQAAGISNLRTAPPAASAGTSWRGPHLAFDYYGVAVAFGSDLDGPRATELLRLVAGRLALASAGVAAPASAPRPVMAPLSGFPTFRAAQEGTRPQAATVTPGITKLAAGLEAELSPLSTVALIIANLVPLAGVWLLGWDIGEIMLLYWAESGIIGLFNLVKMAVVGGWATLFLGPFFVGHYGAFMAVHLLFVYTFFVKGLPGGGEISISEVSGHFLALWPALLALAVSHGVSFVVNFLGRREYAETTVQKQMAEPYGRIITMHLTIIFGGFVVMGLGSSLPALLLLMFAKIIADLRAHTRQRR